MIYSCILPIIQLTKITKLSSKIKVGVKHVTVKAKKRKKKRVGTNDLFMLYLSFFINKEETQIKYLKLSKKSSSKL